MVQDRSKLHKQISYFNWKGSLIKYEDDIYIYTYIYIHIHIYIYIILLKVYHEYHYRWKSKYFLPPKICSSIFFHWKSIHKKIITTENKFTFFLTLVSWFLFCFVFLPMKISSYNLSFFHHWKLVDVYFFNHWIHIILLIFFIEICFTYLFTIKFTGLFYHRK